jgi:hypothetical protein
MAHDSGKKEMQWKNRSIWHMTPATSTIDPRGRFIASPREITEPPDIIISVFQFTSATRMQFASSYRSIYIRVGGNL